MRHMRGECIVSSCMHWEKYRVLTFDSKSELWYKSQGSHLNADTDDDADAAMQITSFSIGPLIWKPLRIKEKLCAIVIWSFDFII